MSHRRARCGQRLPQRNQRNLGQVGRIEEMEERICLSTYVVTTSGDGAGAVKRLIPGIYTATTLRAAVNAANAAPGADTVLFNPLSSKPIVLTGGELPITDTLTIQGWGANHTTIDGGGASRVFSVAANVTASINDVTITNSKVDGVAGGGVRNAGTLTLRDDAITNNVSTADGGGVFNTGTGMLTVNGSTFSGNSAAGSGGALLNAGAASIVNSTFANNSAGAFGGAIDNESGSTLLVSNSTIANNHANFSGGGIASTLDDPTTMAPGTRLNNTIVAGNSYTPGAAPAGTAQNPDLYGFFDTASSNNLIGNLGAAKGLDPTLNLLGGINNATPAIDAKLSPLGYYGGATQTMPPMAGSPAIDAGNNSLVPTGIVTDQRSLPRVLGKAVDIGAVESIPPRTPPKLLFAAAIDGLIDKLKGLF